MLAKPCVRLAKENKWRQVIVASMTSNNTEKLSAYYTQQLCHGWSSDQLTTIGCANEHHHSKPLTRSRTSSRIAPSNALSSALAATPGTDMYALSAARKLPSSHSRRLTTALRAAWWRDYIRTGHCTQHNVDAHATGSMDAATATHTSQLLHVGCACHARGCHGVVVALPWLLQPLQPLRST